MNNDEPTMTRDELSAAIAQLTDPAWVATIPTYREKQHHRYTLAMAQGRQDAAMDALWRAASEADLLMPHERSHEDLVEQRVNHLLRRFGW